MKVRGIYNRCGIMFSPGGMIVREREPLNLEMPFGSLDGFITPANCFFVRSHSSIPKIDAKTWRFHASGVVFAVCENTMKRMQITRDQLVPLASTVDSGVSEVIRKQEAGYAYIKSGG